MSKELIVVLVISSVVLVGAIGFVCGGVLTRPARSQLADVTAAAELAVAERVAAVIAERDELAADLEAANRRIANLISQANRAYASRSSSPAAIAVEPASTSDFDVAKLVADGVIYSIDEQSHQVRIDPITWGMLDYDIKKNIVFYFADYMDKRTGGMWVDILSSRSDDKLAKFGVFGLKVYK
jgi:hypothetical protein